MFKMFHFMRGPWGWMPEIRVPCLLNFPMLWLCAAGPAQLSTWSTRSTLKVACKATTVPLTQTACVGSTQEPQARELNKNLSGACFRWYVYSGCSLEGGWRTL